jgi:hypothetical protein
MKIKSSIVLQKALDLIQNGEQNFACAAIQDVETQMRWDANGENVTSKAQKVFNGFMPDAIVRNASIMEWWPKGAPERVTALQEAIKAAKKAND